MSLQHTHAHTHTYTRRGRGWMEREREREKKRGGCPDAKAAAATASCPRSFRFDSPLLLQFDSPLSPLSSLLPHPFPSLSLSLALSPSLCLSLIFSSPSASSFIVIFFSSSKRLDVQSPCDHWEQCIDAFCCQCARSLARSLSVLYSLVRGVSPV